jgi:uncharacterized protein DUF4406
MTKIYISGKITGVETEAPQLFEKAAKELLNNGYDPVNPLLINHDEHDKTWHSYMKADIKALCDCDAIYMLRNWTDSTGAIIEHALAIQLGLQIHYESAASLYINK